MRGERSAGRTASHPVSSGLRQRPPACEVFLGGGCSRKLRQASPDHWDRSQPLSGPRAPPGIQEAAVQATSRGRPGLGPLRSAPPACPSPTSPRPAPGDPEALRSYPGRCSSSPQARPRRTSVRKPGPAPQTPALSWGTAQPSRAPGRARGCKPLAILGTGSQLTREAQKERRVIVRRTVALQK